MNTLQLRDLLQRFNTPTSPIIVCAVDELPTIRLKRGKNYGFVVNLSPKSSPGSHWIAIYIQNIDGEQLGYYIRPRSAYLTKFLRKNCSRIGYSKRQLQQLHTNVCGMYAAYFLIHMINGFPFSAFLSKFSRNLLINDHFIVKIYNYYLRNYLTNQLAN